MIEEKNINEPQSPVFLVGAAIIRFYAVFSDYGTDFSQRSIWFNDINEAIEFKQEMSSRKGKFIILEKAGENGL
jgi:hypothetical protein